MKVNGEGSHTRPFTLHPDHYTSMLQIIFTLNTKNDSIKVHDLQKNHKNRIHTKYAY